MHFFGFGYILLSITIPIQTSAMYPNILANNIKPNDDNKCKLTLINLVHVRKK